MTGLLIWLLLVPVVVLSIYALLIWHRARRRRKLYATPLPTKYLQIVERNVPLYSRLPGSLQQQLRGHMQVFLYEKRFFGCDGLEITDEMRVTVAAFACMLFLNRKADYYPAFKSVFIYPGEYFGRKGDWNSDVTMDDVGGRFGEAWYRGPVVLAWDSVLHGARDMKDGNNVVLHEFAHKIDEADGVIDGTPAINQRSSYITWARIMSKQFELFEAEADKGSKTVMDHYGASNAAEFFAVLVETFYEKPKQLKKKHPELYEQMQRFFNVDPVNWNGN